MKVGVGDPLVAGVVPDGVVAVVEVAVSGVAMIIVVLVAAGAIDADAVINCVVVGDVI